MAATTGAVVAAEAEMPVAEAAILGLSKKRRMRSRIKRKL